VEVEFEGRTIWSQDLEVGHDLPLDVRIPAKPGRNYLYFKTDRPPVLQENQQMVRLSYGLINLLIFVNPTNQP